MKPKRIPLFPLDVVLFPGAALPLHIFEPRYKQMIRRCLNMKLEFGVILAHKQGIATIGCTAAIVTLVKQHPDGKMDILARGGTPFQVKEIFDDKPYYEAAIECFDEAADAYPAASNELMEVYEQCHWLLFNHAPDMQPSKSKLSPAYAMAGSLPLELDQKQTLLEMRSEADRQAHLLEQLKEWLPRLVYLNEKRQRARGNGHSLN
ncbi:MAG TPA: LON peptidase substrate-binding domain-containing protein [Candidatus Acidoferrales bacterium]|nr:LON peptidase substrate-binding domain-containing protein [Candidatus Acidoferrales bacterium]